MAYTVELGDLTLAQWQELVDKVFTKKLRSEIPVLYSTENDGDNAVVQTRFFLTFSAWTLYVLEASIRDQAGVYRPLSTDISTLEHGYYDIILFGFVSGVPFPELGYTSFNEMIALRNRVGLPVEREVYFTPVPMSTVRLREGV